MPLVRLALEVEVTGRQARIRASGELDVVSASRLRNAVRDQLWRGRSVELDLSDVHFIDATGGRLLVRLYQSARPVSISICSPAIERLLTLVGHGDVCERRGGDR